jgi:tetratricopeptide (TPR) repeat protein
MPLFLATSEDDPDFGVSDLMQWIATFSTNPRTKFVRYKTGGHGVELFPVHPELPPMIVDWLTAALKSPGAASAKASPYSSPVTTFFEALDQPNPNASELYAAYRSKNSQEIPYLEVILNRLGYDRLQNNDHAGAITVLKLNTSIFPASPNVYDSLGDAYLADGQKELARQNAQKALELLANDTKDPEDRRKGIRESAEQKLKQLSATMPN